MSEVALRAGAGIGVGLVHEVASSEQVGSRSVVSVPCLGAFRDRNPDVFRAGKGSCVVPTGQAYLDLHAGTYLGRQAKGTWVYSRENDEPRTSRSAVLASDISHVSGWETSETSHRAAAVGTAMSVTAAAAAAAEDGCPSVPQCF